MDDVTDGKHARACCGRRSAAVALLRLYRRPTLYSAAWALGLIAMQAGLLGCRLFVVLGRHLFLLGSLMLAVGIPSACCALCPAWHTFDARWQIHTQTVSSAANLIAQTAPNSRSLSDTLLCLSTSKGLCFQPAPPPSVFKKVSKHMCLYDANGGD